MDKADIPFLSVAELARLIERKDVSPVEVPDGYLERIDRLNDRLRAFLTISRDAALEAAHEAEQSIAQGTYLGPMHGVPIAVKDQLYTQGIRTTGGSPIFNDFVPVEDAAITLQTIPCDRTKCTRGRGTRTRRKRAVLNPHLGVQASGDGDGREPERFVKTRKERHDGNGPRDQAPLPRSIDRNRPRGEAGWRFPQGLG